eukprot:gnl/Chilomastix_cuspidata/8440.p1 GENE.gnl/Chilomastix_cuspidata/8440~~gnl/Chilomastix_cuspidata/8440.p1  ORF type:complete len:133 (+),score=4.89 gnl/Chilomastix_cuspidata/8440:209-607(+)
METRRGNGDGCSHCSPQRCRDEATFTCPYAPREQGAAVPPRTPELPRQDHLVTHGRPKGPQCPLRGCRGRRLEHPDALNANGLQHLESRSNSLKYSFTRNKITCVKGFFRKNQVVRNGGYINSASRVYILSN